ncbi:MAG: tRNA (N6-threonylcarbamoyladenosine(37)-N6)-methyltransferase TrmO [Candidatus Methylarchaceae archaeon HK02M2]|nr:tRNA (N6-threonylcarbamoyladenosine(37)-N6)-methyltransferase TrmO [Candidatus Methylarchaceae archaeon HK02M2]
MNEIKYRPIGIIYSPYKEPRGIPIQPTAAQDIEGTIEIFPEYTEGLKDIEGFSHIILIYHLHLSKDFSLKVKPHMDDNLRGVFATRSPSRPNPIGISIVRLNKVDRNILYIRNIDIVNGTPLLDIKPYVPEFDVWKVERKGWLDKKINKLRKVKDDGRFKR